MDPPEHDRLRGAREPGLYAAGGRLRSSRWCARSSPRSSTQLGDADRLRRGRRTSARPSPSRSSRGCSACPRRTASRSVTARPQLHREPGSADTDSRGRAGGHRVWARTSGSLSSEKRKHPGDDMMSRLTQVTVDRGDGTETGARRRRNRGVRRPARRRRRGDRHQGCRERRRPLRPHTPTSGRRCVDDRAKVPRAVEEILRYPAAVADTRAVRSHDERTFEGGTIPAGMRRSCC